VLAAAVARQASAQEFADHLLAAERAASQAAVRESARLRRAWEQQLTEGQVGRRQRLQEATDARQQADQRLWDLSQQSEVDEFAVRMAHIDLSAAEADVTGASALLQFYDADSELAMLFDVGWQGIAQQLADVRRRAERRRTVRQWLRRLRYALYAGVLLAVKHLTGGLTSGRVVATLAVGAVIWVVDRFLLKPTLDRSEAARTLQALQEELALHLLLWLRFRHLESMLVGTAVQARTTARRFVPMNLFVHDPDTDTDSEEGTDPRPQRRDPMTPP